MALGLSPAPRAESFKVGKVWKYLVDESGGESGYVHVENERHERKEGE